MTPEPGDRSNCYNCAKSRPNEKYGGLTWCFKQDEGVGILMARMKLEQWCCEEWQPKRPGVGIAKYITPMSQRRLDL